MKKYGKWLILYYVNFNSMYIFLDLRNKDWNYEKDPAKKTGNKWLERQG